MAEAEAKLSPAEHLDRRIREHIERRERWAAEHGDPQEAMGRFLIERFGLEALQETYEEYQRNRSSFRGDDEGEMEPEDETTHARERS